MTKTDASRLFGQIVNYLILEYYPPGEESLRFPVRKIVTIDNNGIDWPATARNIIPRYLSLLPLHMIQDLGAIDKFCQESHRVYPLDFEAFTAGLTADFMNDVIWDKNELSEKREILTFYNSYAPSDGNTRNRPNTVLITYTCDTDYACSAIENGFHPNSQPVNNRQPFYFVRKAWASFISWVIVFF